MSALEFGLWPELAPRAACLPRASYREHFPGRTAYLFLVADIQDIGYWVAKIQSEVVVHGFIAAYGYQENVEKLIRFYRENESPYRNWFFPINMIHRPRLATGKAARTAQSSASSRRRQDKR